MTERPDKNYATQVFYSMSAGATRMQETGVVEIACIE
ncbi:MAG: phage capsid protein [Alphaproteobacteria bacterium]